MTGVVVGVEADEVRIEDSEENLAPYGQNPDQMDGAILANCYTRTGRVESGHSPVDLARGERRVQEETDLYPGDFRRGVVFTFHALENRLDVCGTWLDAVV